MFFWLLACQQEILVCRNDDDCSSGVCQADGTCLDAPIDPPESQFQESEDTGLEPTADPSSDLCTPNHDGVITDTEYPLIMDASVPFFLSLSANVDLSQDEFGFWDFTEVQEEQTYVVAQSLDGLWFADEFPSSTYSAILSYEEQTMGVFTRTAQGVFLDGIVSIDSGPFSTLLIYDPPVPVALFPLEIGMEWSHSSTVSGFLDGVYGYYEEVYTSDIIEDGDVYTHRGDFPVLRVDTRIERTIGFLTYQNRSVGFVSECYGTVVSMSSLLNEEQRDFTTATQVLVIAQ